MGVKKLESNHDRVEIEVVLKKHHNLWTIFYYYFYYSYIYRFAALPPLMSHPAQISILLLGSRLLIDKLSPIIQMMSF